MNTISDSGARGELPQHPYGERIDAQHACPECPIGTPRADCGVCAGTGLLTGDQLARYVDLLWRARL
ncbi:MAG TPA: hypothetical protein VHA75_01055 [Rugosimonospora sp.]|nr:hypothetical protein [Rugosimonospora sp.]